MMPVSPAAVAGLPTSIVNEPLTMAETLIAQEGLEP